MKVQALVSTIDCLDTESLVRNMNLRTYLLVNQRSKKINPDQKKRGKNVFNSTERGLSKSRNFAIDHAMADVCLFADDDMRYISDYEEIVKSGYERFPKADIILFRVDTHDGCEIKLKQGRVGLLRTMRACSVLISFRLDAVRTRKIRLREDFGAGSDNYMGEENIFLADCIRAGLKVYSCPKKVACLQASESTWFKGYNEKYFRIKGKVFFLISPILAPILVLRFAIRKYSLYRSDMGFLSSIRSMLRGVYDQQGAR